MKRHGKMTLLELLALVIIVWEILFMLNGAFHWFDFRISTGNDGGYVNTCESVATINSMNGVQCPVNDCKGVDCMHRTAVGYVGYFDSVSNKIVGRKTKGYNSTDKPKAQGKTYKGEPGTMVLKVTVFNGDINISWTGGGQ